MTAPRTVLGDAEVLHALKSGGMGEVLLARRRGPGGFEQLCAIKTIRGDLAAAPLARTMFLDEARLLARLTHPAIAQILDFGEQDQTLYMVIEYVPGQHFRRFGERRPPPAIVCAAVAAACRGLHAAHELRDVGDGHLLGVVHRDVSPDNLMLGFDARVKVLDFGIALVKGRQAPVTEYGVLKGKPPYMSPEQIKNEALDRRADVFSTCAVLHELLTGQVLFTGDSIYAIARAVEHQPIAPPSASCGPLPRDLDDVIMAGLERDLDRRLASAAALAEVLERIAAAHATESLEAWTERELAAEREAHRTWLARIVAASGPMRVAGRPTGTVTAIGELPTVVTPGALPPAPPVSAAPPAPPVLGERVTELARDLTGGGAAATTAVAPRPRPGRAALVAVVLVAVLAVAALLTARACGTAAVVAGGDAAPIADAPVAADARVPVAVDAAAPVDARAEVPPADAARPPRHRDAGVIAVPLDAAPPPRPGDAAVAAATADAAVAPVGTGFLTCTADPYALVAVDGQDFGATPFYRRKLAAGRHEVVFTSPLDGTTVLRRTIDVAPGQTVTVP